jgi:hypothetical protein
LFFGQTCSPLKRSDVSHRWLIALGYAKDKSGLRSAETRLEVIFQVNSACGLRFKSIVCYVKDSD